MIVAGALGGLTAAWLLFGWVTSLVTTTSPLVLALVWLLPNLVLTLVAYLVASFVVAPILPPNPAANVAAALPRSLPEEFARGVTLGINAFYNFSVVWLVMGPFLAIGLPGLCLGCALPAFARDARYKAVIGWIGWLLPSAIVASLIGFVLFLISVIMNPFQATTGRYRIDWTTGTIETAGGLVNAIPTAGFGVGNFTFISLVQGPGPGPSFREAQLSSHETGHTINTAAFGGPFLLINWIDENVVQPALAGRSGMDAYAELLAEGHYPEGGWKSILHWS